MIRVYVLLMKIKITVQPSFKNYNKQYIYSSVEDPEVKLVFFFQIMMQV
jgi:hypothetical protein